MIPVSQPIIPKKTAHYLLECIKSNWFSGEGPFVKQFEDKFARYLGTKYAISTPSGTSALHLALTGLGIRAGDEVIVPTFTMASTVFAILYCSAKPVLVDSEPFTGNLDISQVDKKVTPRTKVILAVHIYGHPVDLDPLLNMARKFRLYLVEDAAEALGAQYKGRLVGTLGDVSCFSFYSNKTLTTGEGGMVVTNRAKLAQKMRVLKNYAISPHHRFRHEDVGFNYKMTNLQAALGLAQIEQIRYLIQARNAVSQKYSQYLKFIPTIKPLSTAPWATRINWMYGITINPRVISKDQLRQKLKAKGIDTRDFFIPMHRQPVFKKLGLFQGEKYPVADRLSQSGFYLPSGPAITTSEIKFICSTLKDIYAQLPPLS